jgi:hypothetical protein
LRFIAPVRILLRARRARGIPDTTDPYAAALRIARSRIALTAGSQARSREAR